MLLFSDINNDYAQYLNGNEVLFHFTKKNIAIEHILFEGKLLLGGLSKTNDPREYQEKLSGVTGYNLGEERLSRSLSIKRKVDDIILDRTGFISFCLNTLDEYSKQKEAYVNSRMWSQYGENHEGVCLVFSKQKIEEIIKEEYSNNEEYIRQCTQIEYIDFIQSNDSILELDKSKMDTMSEDDISLLCLEENYHQLLFRKQIDYKDENEYRVCITDRKRNKEKVINIRGALKAVILGDRFHMAYYKTMEYLCTKNECKLLKLMWDYEGYILSSLL
jgi:hypothetical protein